MSYRRDSEESPRGSEWAVGALVVVVVVALVVAAIGFLFAYRSVDAGQVALRFGGGAFDGRNGKFKAVYGPGRHNMGLGDKVFPYPDTVRNYVFAGTPEQRQGDAPAVPIATRSTDPTVPAGSKVEMTGQFLFHLNTGPALGDFHARYGVRYRAFEGFDDPDPDDGWARMLNETFRPAAESAITAAGRDFTVDDLGKQDRIDAFEARVAQTVTRTLHDRMAGPFFCGPDFDRRRPETCTATRQADGQTVFVAPIRFQLKPVLPPTALTDAATRLAVAQRNTAAAREEAKAIAIAQDQGLSGMAYVANECRKDPECRAHMVFVAGGASVTVPGK